MSIAIRRTPQLGHDIVEIYGFIYERNPASAERVIDAIESAIAGLNDAPRRGRLWDSPHPWLEGLRVTTVSRFPNYLIFYRLTVDAIEVFRVVHGARELQRLIDEIELEFE